MQLLRQRHELYLWRRRNMQQLDQFIHHSVGAFRLMHGDQALDRQQRIVKEMRVDLRLQKIIFSPLLLLFADTDIINQFLNSMYHAVKGGTEHIGFFVFVLDRQFTQLFNRHISDLIRKVGQHLRNASASPVRNACCNNTAEQYNRQTIPHGFQSVPQ